jgi:putative membrane protein
VRQTAPMEQTEATPPDPVDNRFLLANERTYLAYVRTALSLQIAGFGVLQFLTHGQDAVRYTLGVTFVVAGSFTGLVGVRRWRANERAIRAGRDIGPARGAVVAAAAVVAVPLMAAVALAVVALT